MTFLAQIIGSNGSRNCSSFHPAQRVDVNSSGIVARTKTLVFLILTISYASFSFTYAADTLTASEYQMKGLIIRAIAKFSPWPEDAFENGTAPIVFGILGEVPFGNYLETEIFNAGKIKGRDVVVRRFSKLGDLQDIHILFISNSEQSELSRILQTVRQRPILTIGDMDDFAVRGGILHLHLLKGKVAYDLNRAAATQARLTINAQILQLANKIHMKVPKEVE